MKIVTIGNTSMKMLDVATMPPAGDKHQSRRGPTDLMCDLSHNLAIPRVLLSFLLLSTVTAVQAAAGDYDFSKKDGTVINKVNGLVWRLCHAGETYNGQDCTGEPRYYTGIEAVKLTDTFAGFNDWRLPTFEEISTLRELKRDDPKYWPYLPANGSLYQSDCAWSSTHDDSAYTKYLKVLQAGYFATNVKDERESCTVYLVRGTKVPDWTSDANGTSKYFKTNLIWQTCPFGQTWNGKSCDGTEKIYNWRTGGEAARSGVFKSNFLGYSDWRLPTMDELKASGFTNGGGILDYGAYSPYNPSLDPDVIANSMGIASVLQYKVYLVRTPTDAPTPSPAPSPTNAGFSITSNEYDSPRNSKKLAVKISGPASTNAVYVWAYVKTMGEFCYTRSGDWISYTSSDTLSSGKGRCPEPARTLYNSESGSRANADVLWNADLSSPLFDQTRVFVTLEPAGSTPTAAVKNQKVMEFGGSAWQ